MSYNAATIASVIAPGAKLYNPQSTVEHLLTDSRRIVYPATSIFFALPGVAKNGIQFLKQAHRAGVRNFVVPALSPEELLESNIFVVPDVLAALQSLAAYHRKQFSIPVIGITGSNGKTIVKEWLYQLLQDDFNIVRSPKSYNSQLGVPLSIWQMNSQHTLAIIEAGISQPGEMQKLRHIIRPTIGILTNIGAAHDEGFESRLQKSSEKLKLFAGAGVIIGKEEELKHTGLTEPVFAWGAATTCAVQLLQVKREKEHSTLNVLFDNQTHSFRIPFIDEASIENAVTCISVLLYLAYEASVINERLLWLHAVDMRLQLKSGINHCTIINDSYSADLTSLDIALHFLVQQHAFKQRIVILSDFAESGKEPGNLYHIIADALFTNKVSQVVAIGEHITQHLPLFLPATITVHTYKTTEEFFQNFPRSVFKDASILIKGARTFGFERIVQILETKVHQTVLEIDLAAIAHNLKEYRRVMPRTTKIMAMVKAFSYGSGSAEIAGVLQFNGADYLGVAYADEGIELRKAGIHLPVMVLNTDEVSFAALIEFNLQPVIYSFNMLQLFTNYLLEQGLANFGVHIEIETGMNRLGFAASEMPHLCAYLVAHPILKVETVFTHLAAGEDQTQDDFTNRQADMFLKAAAQLQHVLPYPFLKHIANSAAVIRHPALAMDMVRIGIGIYGVEMATDVLDLKPAATLRSTIAQIKFLKKGESVSYGRKATVDRDSMIATVRIGYADGYSRRLSTGIGKMWVKGELAPVIGVVCMDMTMIDITGIDGVNEGDDVVIFGKGLPVQQLAKWAGTIPYEVMTSISQRVKRVYFQE
ncbi:MAG TPA: bifunctional UDP-N-acetylmuramoyl-tripeptide:D-alanyl-D-alanine ligase/alanine racemase [Flavisolibacter sp.]|nr:bifunctional UDP-N-acetylmuramoyl-tripeptide:D-alanyl-D-alanine ligase/alanine racemase [Flavisolibacter sp.]